MLLNVLLSIRLRDLWLICTVGVLTVVLLFFVIARLWRDVTAKLKLHDVEEATEHKHRIEQRQRDDAKRRAENGETWDTRVTMPVMLLFSFHRHPVTILVKAVWLRAHHTKLKDASVSNWLSVTIWQWCFKKRQLAFYFGQLVFIFVWLSCSCQLVTTAATVILVVVFWVNEG